MGVALGLNFRLDDESGSTTLRNDMPLHGSVQADGSAFQLSGTFQQDNIAVVFDVLGTPTQTPPVAGFSPNSGDIECNALGGAYVTFVSSAYDHDNDIRSIVWSADQEPLVSAGDFVHFLSLGGHTMDQIVQDSRAALASTSGTVNVRDTSPPVLTQPTDLVVVDCSDEGPVLSIGSPTATDTCGAPTIHATVVDVNGVSAATLLDSTTRFRQGTTTLRFEASDASGNSSTVTQRIIVERGAACCPTNMSVLSGTSSNDTLRGGNKSQCIDGLGGNDSIEPGNARDIVFGGAGDDSVQASNGGDTIYGGSGNDVLTGGNSADVLWGGSGDDHLVGANGPDVLRGGAGKDVMEGGNGPDTFIIAAECEAVAGEILRGGAGNDTVESPLTRAELEAKGVLLEDIENVVVVPPLPGAECP